MTAPTPAVEVLPLRCSGYLCTAQSEVQVAWQPRGTEQRPVRGYVLHAPQCHPCAQLLVANLEARGANVLELVL